MLRRLPLIALLAVAGVIIALQQVGVLSWRDGPVSAQVSDVAPQVGIVFDQVAHRYDDPLMACLILRGRSGGTPALECVPKPPTATGSASPGAPVTPQGITNLPWQAPPAGAVPVLSIGGRATLDLPEGWRSWRLQGESMHPISGPGHQAITVPAIESEIKTGSLIVVEGTLCNGGKPYMHQVLSITPADSGRGEWAATTWGVSQVVADWFCPVALRNIAGRVVAIVYG